MIPGLAHLAPNYQGIVCDVWGVLHNGVVGYADAGEALRKFRETTGKPVVLLTNAPRPAPHIATMLDKFQIPRDAYDAIVTSGDVTTERLRREVHLPSYFIGPERDIPMLGDLGITLVGEGDAKLLICTGLFDDDTETPETYRASFERLVAADVPMICANPDVVVERGHRLIFCAGALAQLYAEMGGRTELYGKPYKPVYDVALETLSTLAGTPVVAKDVLAIGDALPTDVRGGWGQGMDVLMVTAGIHAADFGPADEPDPALVAKRLAIEGIVAKAAIPRLKW